MIDNIALLEATPINSGFMGSPIRLATIHSALSDRDAPKRCPWLFYCRLSVGSQLSDGSHTLTAATDNGRADVTEWNLAQLSYPRATPTR
jgi:hypothetical protein